MTPEELVELFRLDVDDTDADDPLWSSLEVYGYLDAAQKEFARKTDYFSDASTAAVCLVTITANDPWVTLSPRITKIRNAYLSGTGAKVTPKTFADMDGTPTSGVYSSENSTYAWMQRTGTPAYLITDMEKDKGRLTPIPVINGTLALNVYRLPLKDVTEGCVSLEITEIDYQRKLIPYMKYLAYSKNDVDTMELALADRALAEAQAVFDDVKAQLRRQRYSAHTGTVRYGGL